MNASAAHQYIPQDDNDQIVLEILQHAVKYQNLFPQSVEIKGYNLQSHSGQTQITVQTAAGAYFIKCRSLDSHLQSLAEQRCLKTLMQSNTLATCAPLAASTFSSDTQQISYLILQHLPLAVHGDWFSAGQQLAQMHQHESEQGYGFGCTTYCGDTPQDNNWNTNWADFFIQQRLMPLINQLEQQHIRFSNSESCLQKCQQILSDHQPAAALLHGDLWSGNVGFNPDKSLAYPMVFDPASYYGDGETDLAMTELFGRFPKKFYQGYHSVIAADSGYEMRRPIYQLYHILNHALLFGEHYIDQAEQLIQEILFH